MIVSSSVPSGAGRRRLRSLFPGRVELVLDHAQRQELLALHAQNRLQALEIVLAEQPIPALRAPRRHQPLVLEVADLRDRDVGELLEEPPHDLSDPEQLLALRLAAGSVVIGAPHAMNVIRYLPICSSSPSASGADSMRLRFTNVPFSDPWSSTTITAVTLDQHGVIAGNGDVVEEDLAVGRAADARALADRLEALPRPSAAGAHDQRRTFESEVARGPGARRPRPPRTSESSPPTPHPSTAAHRSGSSSSRPRGSGSRTRCSTRRSRRRRSLPGQNLGQTVDVDLVEHAATA